MKTDAATIFEDSLDWLQGHYTDFCFYQERDIVWTLQKQLNCLIKERNLPLKVFNDYGIIADGKKYLVDLAIIGEGEEVQLAAEFKYEPSHKRRDIPPSKFPVVFWDEEGVKGDIARIAHLVESETIPIGRTVFIDEGGHFRDREPPAGSKWIDWELSIGGGRRVSVLRSERSVAT